MKEDIIQKGFTHLFKFSECKDIESHESEIKVKRCRFIDIDQITSKFNIKERDDMKGFAVHMENLTIVPSTYICIKEAPVWMKWLIKKFCKM